MKQTSIMIGASATVMLAFGSWPQLDIATAAVFFDGTGFPLASNPLNNALRWVLRWTPFLPLIVGIFVLCAGARVPDLVCGLPRRDWAAIVLTFVLGPALLVNLGLKAHWGRARPRDVTEFGGDALFTPPHQLADQCAANCSFVSGEVSAVMSLTLVLIMLLAANKGRMGLRAYQSGLVIAWMLPFLSAFQRISAGGHFLSDTIMAVLLTLIVARFCNGLVAVSPVDNQSQPAYLPPINA